MEEGEILSKKRPKYFPWEPTLLLLIHITNLIVHVWVLKTQEVECSLKESSAALLNKDL